MEVETDKENAGPGAPRAFSPGELKNMLGQCLKMASENKITPQNTWALPLIEHLPELIREEGGQQTNFQRASVTLDAGVKIYSYRVDSVHTETFKILGGLGRASNDAEDEPGAWRCRWVGPNLRRSAAAALSLSCQAAGPPLVLPHVKPRCTGSSSIYIINLSDSSSPCRHPQRASWATAAWTTARMRAGGGGAATS